MLPARSTTIDVLKDSIGERLKNITQRRRHRTFFGCDATVERSF